MRRRERLVPPPGASTGIAAVLGFALSLLVISCTSASAPPPGARHPETEPDYLALVERFPQQSAGLGFDPYLAPGETADHLQAHALVLSAEARRWVATRSPDAAARIRACWRHLLDTRDLDGDGKPGWGTSFAWDPFGDGSPNPADWPYTITTAQVLEGFFDAIEAFPGLFSEEEVLETEAVIRATWSRWYGEAWTQEADRGWFWYSPAPVDSENVLNVNGMMLSVAARALGHSWTSLDEGFLEGVRKAAGDLGRSLLAEVEYRAGKPFWPYLAGSNRYGSHGPNDAVHHVYVAWGLERARRLGLAQLVVPFSRAQALESVHAFFRAGAAFDFPQDIQYSGEFASFNERPMVLWGLGAALAFLGEFGPPSSPGLAEAVDILRTTYGPVPNLRLWPADYSQDARFHPRHGAHALLGLAAVTFGPTSSANVAEGPPQTGRLGSSLE